MSDDEDDYLSDKFLAASTSTSVPKTYSNLRKEAEKQSRLRNEQNRQKSRKERERDAREEGLSKSLFERAKEDQEDTGASNKALSIMMKMGFQPGQSLGKVEDGKPAEGTKLLPEAQHKTAPLPLNEWEGRTGIGVKRKLSASSLDRMAKMSKLANDASNDQFRDRSRQVYEERRAEGRLGPAQRTCVTLDEQAGKSFNVLWLNPTREDSFPPGLIDTLARYTNAALPTAAKPGDGDETIATRLRRQMQADSLQPLDGLDILEAPSNPEEDYSEILEEAAQFLKLQAPARLQLVLGYLRERYSYCFWCGVGYEDAENLSRNCPGMNEEDHD